MRVGNVVVSQEAPAKNHLWIQPKGSARFWNGNMWKMISGGGGGGGGGGDDYYTKAQADERFYLNSNINGVNGYAAKFNGTRTLTYASDYIRIGDGIIYWDSVNGGFRVYHSDLLTNPQSISKAGIYADWVSALGANNEVGPGGGGDINWENLVFANGSNDPNKILLKDSTDETGTKRTPEFAVPYATKATNDANGNNIVNTYLSKTEAVNTYLSIAFFERLFQAYNNTTVIHPNDTTSTIDSIKAMFGFWTEQYISALGQNGSSGGGGGFDWDMLITYDGDATHIINSSYLPDAYLPLSGGTLTGTLQVNSIEATNGNGLLCYHPTGWTAVSNTQWGLGAIDSQGVIRSNNSNLIHYKGGTNYTILDTSNSAAVNFGTTNYLAYYSSTNGISADPHIRRDDNYLYIDYSTATATGFCCKNSLYTINYHLAASGNRGIYEGSPAGGWLLYWPNGGYTATLPKGGLTASGTVTAGAGYLKSTYNSNTVTIGSQSANWCHIYNSADVPFIFNKSVCSAGDNTDAGSALGSYNYPWHVLYLGGLTNATMGNTTTNPRIVFFESSSTPGNAGNQAVALTYTDYDSYRSSKGLKVHDMDGNDASNVWFEVQGACYCNGLLSSSYVTALATNSSDKRLKKNIKPFNATEIIEKLKPVQFEWNNKAKKYNENFKDGKNYGLIAQDSDGIVDDLVFDLPDGKGYKGVRYEKLIPILLQAIKEQNEKIENLEYEINVLKGIYK